VTQELQKISNSIGVANQGITANTNNLAAVEGAWTAYTPTISAGSGTLTTASASGRYKIVGKTVFILLSFSVTTNGTGASFLNVSLPVAPAVNFHLTGREQSLTGKMIQAISAGGTATSIIYYDNSYPGVNGSTFILGGSYESV
jgi:hypothetical protein